MNRTTYMLDTNLCSYIMRQRPAPVLQQLDQVSARQHRIVVSAITYAEMRFGAASPKTSPRTARWSRKICVHSNVSRA